MGNQAEPIYETRDDNMVSFRTGKSTARTGRFLKPVAKQINKAIAVPNSPLLSEIISHRRQEWTSIVHFKGWHSPQIKWKQWVDKLALRYSSIWVQTGICDAILSSICEFHRYHDLILGLSEFWCSDTNTFVFPWGEATVTLEDVSILGGYPVIGEAVNGPRTDELVKIEEEMEKNRVLLSKSRAKKAEHSGWLKHFMETDDEFEHVAFLSLWLSRYVFPSLAEETVSKNVFPIAAKLSKGIQVALAPAVLASLYRDLRTIREQALDSRDTIRVSGPFQLVQIWAYERFRILGPKPLDSVQPGEPRVARWHRLNTKLNVPLVKLALKSGENFQWRPYAAKLKNWKHPSYYKETDQLMIDCSSLDDQDLRSFLRCLQCSELVGIDCKERYRPHRVAMQFGMDQDIPAHFASFNISNFFVPARLFQPCVSMRYSHWWNNMMSVREGAITGILRRRDLDRASEVLKKPIVVPPPNMVKKHACDDSSGDNFLIATLTAKKQACDDPSNDSVPITTGMVEKQVCDDSSDDDVPIAIRRRELWNQLQAKGSNGTRMTSAVKDGNSCEKETIQSVKSEGIDMERNEFPREVIRENARSNIAKHKKGIKFSKERFDRGVCLPPRSVYWPPNAPPMQHKVQPQAKEKWSKYLIPSNTKKQRSWNDPRISTHKKTHFDPQKSYAFSRERRSFASHEGNVATKSNVGRRMGKEVKRDDSKKRRGEPLDPLDFAFLSQRIKHRIGSKELLKGKKRKEYEGGESRNNPVNVNIYMDNSSRYKGHGLEERMQTLEKLLGVKSGCSVPTK